MEIRSLGPADAGAFQALRLRGLRECPTAFASSYEEEYRDELVVVAERLVEGPNHAILGAFAGSTLIGVVGLQRERPIKLAHKAHLWGMYVAPEFRRKGVGRRLVEQALKRASAMDGVRQVNLSVNANNPAAIALYEALGFRSFGVERGFMLVDGMLQMRCTWLPRQQGAPARHRITVVSYIDSNLLEGEQVVFRTRLHWLLFLGPVLFTVIILLPIAWFVSTTTWSGYAWIPIAVGVFLLLATFIKRVSSDFAVTNKRIMMKVGVFRTRSIEILLSKVEAIAVDQSLLGRVFGYGDIVVTGSGGTRETFQQIQAPLEFRRAVQSVTDKQIAAAT